jgi:lactose/L-arabinose transport system ATP-binding protein
MAVYGDPDNAFVAGFIGSPRMNLVSGRVERVDAGAVSVSFEGLANGSVTVPVRDGSLLPGMTVTIGIRPEHLVADGDGAGTVEATVEFVEHLGSMSFAYAPSFPAGPLIASSDSRKGPQSGLNRQTFRFHGGDCLLFADGGNRIR